MGALSRLRMLTGSDTGKAAELGIAAMLGNVVALVFTLVFTRVLGQSGYGSLGALISTFLILTVAGYALQTTVAREVSGALAAGDPNAGRGVRRWLRRLALLAVGTAVAGVLARKPLATVIGVEDVPWGRRRRRCPRRAVARAVGGARARCSASSATGSWA